MLHRSQALRYNESGQLIAHTDCSGKTTRYSYDRLGNPVATTDAAQNVTRYTPDAIGRIEASVRYQFDGEGRLAAAD